MEILIGTIGTLMFCYVLVNLLIQFTEITIVNLFRIKQIIAYIIAICFCIVPLFLKSEWVLLFSIFIAVYFFVESFIARDD